MRWGRWRGRANVRAEGFRRRGDLRWTAACKNLGSGFEEE